MSKSMSSWLRADAFNKKDEYYTPRILVEPILKYLKPNSTIWCPFDTEHSEFVKCFRENGFNVIHSHMWEGKNFLEYEPDESYDYIVSNPPFSQKLEILNRLYSLKKPFAVIMGLPILNYQEIGSFFVDHPLQLLIVDKKVSFDGNTASFNSSYFCYGILPKDLIFTHISHNNSNKNYTPSGMHKDVPQEYIRADLLV